MRLSALGRVDAGCAGAAHGWWLFLIKPYRLLWLFKPGVCITLIKIMGVEGQQEEQTGFPMKTEVFASGENYVMCVSSWDETILAREILSRIQTMKETVQFSGTTVVCQLHISCMTHPRVGWQWSKISSPESAALCSHPDFLVWLSCYLQLGFISRYQPSF